MRHCVFLAVLLSLVLSLSKVSSEPTGETTTAHTESKNPIITETTNATTMAPPETSTPTSNGPSETTSAINTASPETSTPTSTETTNATTMAPPETSTATSNGPSETTNATTVASPETSTPTSTGSSETTSAINTASPETSTPTSTETTNATTVASPGTSTPTSTGSSETTSATNTASPETSTPTSTGSSETTSAINTASPETSTPTSTGSSETTSAINTASPETSTPTSTETTNATNTASPETSTPTSNVDFCHNDPCGSPLAKCVSLNSNFTCLCQYGFYYFNQDCHRAKIFPGVITLRYTVSDSVQTVNSTEYQELLQNVTEFFEGAFSDLTSYKQTVIVEIQPAKEFRNAPSMTVTVTNLFEENSDVDNNTVTAAINKATQQPSSFVSHYRGTTYCAVFKCDNRTTVCEDSEFPKCKCRENFTMTEWDDRSCSGCREDCSANENKYCAKEEGIPTCKCMVNFQEKNGKCVSCPAGYSGENCNNNSELILIIVGTVFGAIILGLVAAVSIISVRSKRKQDPEQKSLIRSGYANPNSSDERHSTMFPRVQTTSGHTNPGYQPNNPYEAPSSNRGPFPARDYEDLYEISREPEGFRMHRRY